MPINRKKKLGQILLDAKMITESELYDALNTQKNSGKKLGRVLIDLGFITEDEIMNILKEQLSIEVVDLNYESIENEAIESLSETIARNHNLIPLKLKGNSIVVALSDPLNIFAIEDVSIYTGKQVKTVLAKEDDIKRKIDMYYSKKQAIKEAETFANEILRFEDEIEFEDENSAPIVKIVNSMLEQAINSNASDIHIEPYENIIRVRNRVDGILKESMLLKPTLLSPIIARIKILSNMDISERRIPQDGRLSYMYYDDEFDMRISSLPTVFGEKIVIRIQNKKGFIKSKQDLGFSDYDMKIFNEIISIPHGIILVSGPTGSGKTTTLYTILNELNNDEKNILTVEDPVESKIHGINQVQVHQKAGLNFANTLRAMLRQDPDIIMVGEIRDSETAEIAVRSAITGHLVLSTIHTNDSATSISRLIDMGVKDYLIGSSLVGIISQRLVRKICTRCKKPYIPLKSEIESMGLGDDVYTFYRGEGCKHCKNTGYSGRIGIYEIMKVNNKIKQAIFLKKSSSDIENIAIKSGMTTISKSCLQKVLDGITTYEEYIRVTYSV